MSDKERDVMDNDVHRSAIIYEAIADTLRQRIVDGTYKPGAPLPSAPALAKQFGVGRDCVRDALQVLLYEGAVVPDGNRPMRVPPKLERELVVLSEGAMMSVRMPSPEERKQLDIESVVGAPVIVISTPGHPDVLFPANRVAVQAATATQGTST